MHSRRTVAKVTRVGYCRGSECCYTRSIQELASHECLRWTSSSYCAWWTPPHGTTPSVHHIINFVSASKILQESKPHKRSSMAVLPVWTRLSLITYSSCFSAKKYALAKTTDTIEARTWKRRPYVEMRPSVKSYGYPFQALVLNKTEHRKEVIKDENMIASFWTVNDCTRYERIFETNFVPKPRYHVSISCQYSLFICDQWR